MPKTNPVWPDPDFWKPANRIKSSLFLLDLEPRPITDNTVVVTASELNMIVRAVHIYLDTEEITDVSDMLSALDLKPRPITNNTVVVTMYELESLIRQVHHDDWA